MQDELNNIRTEFFAQALEAKTEKDYEEIRIAFLGRQGKIANILKRLKDLDPKDRAEVGKLANQVKQTIQEELENAKNKNDQEKGHFDPTIPGKRTDIGHLHLITQAIDKIERIFRDLGFVRRRYPEADWDWYAFEALNFAKDHPARDEWETFWVAKPPKAKMGAMLLTPHTSNGQVREMEKLDSKLPIRMINISKTYRRQSDISHTPMFHQFEGLVVDENISIAHLKGVLEHFVEQYFGEGRAIRLRPHDFEFTEPSFEVDISCDICEGKARLPDGQGCRLCKEGWLELAGAGMVHPNVLKFGGIDPKKYTGFAFGTGVERVLMMQKGIKIPDLRILYSSDLDYLRQF